MARYTPTDSFTIKVPVRREGIPEADREIPEDFNELVIKNEWDWWKFEPRRLEAGDLKSYLILREVLDAFERIAVDYFLRGTDKHERAKNAEFIEERIRKVSRALGVVFNSCPCPIGYQCCNGYCMEHCFLD